MKMDNKKQIIEHIFGGSKMQLRGCVDCRQEYVEFVTEDGKRNMFPLEEVQQLLRDIVKKQLIKTNKGIKELLKRPT